MVAIPITIENPYSDSGTFALTGDTTTPSGSKFVLVVTPDVAGHTLTQPNGQSNTIVNGSSSNSFTLATTGNSNLAVAAGESATIAWDATNTVHVIAGTTATVNVTSQDLIVNEYNPPQDGITSDHTALNTAMTAAQNGLKGRIVFQPGEYYVDNSITLPTFNTGSAVARYEIIGKGVRIRTMANDVTIFSRTVADVNTWTGTTEGVPTMVGFKLLGQAADTATAGTGIRFDGAHNPIFKEMQFLNLNVGAQWLWCMEGIAESIDAEGCLNPFIVSNGFGRITNGDEDNSNSNQFHMRNCRCSLSSASAIGVTVHNAGGMKIENTTVEGTNGDAAIDISYREGPTFITNRHIEIDKLWSETSTLATVIRFDGVGCHLTAKQIQRAVRGGTTPNETVLIDDTGSQQSVITLRDTMLINWQGTTDAYFSNQSRAAGIRNMWRLENLTVNAGETTLLSDASFWANDPATSILLTGHYQQDGVGFITL